MGSGIPYPQERCEHCGVTLTKTAFLLDDIEQDLLVVFCGECALWAQVMRHDRYLLVPL